MCMISLNYTASDAKKKLVSLWGFATFSHNSMRCKNNLEKLRTVFNDFVMNPSGWGGEEGKKR